MTTIRPPDALRDTVARREDGRIPLRTAKKPFADRDQHYPVSASRGENRPDRLAECTDVRLLHPAALPRQERHCRFVEQGSAFISWEGDVHPCYFLWHRYHCFIGDWSKVIQPKVFGRVTEQPLLEIWNSPNFQRFRHNVLKYSYPYCTSCSVGP